MLDKRIITLLAEHGLRIKNNCVIEEKMDCPMDYFSTNRYYKLDGTPIPITYEKIDKKSRLYYDFNYLDDNDKKRWEKSLREYALAKNIINEEELQSIIA